MPVSRSLEGLSAWMASTSQQLVDYASQRVECLHTRLLSDKSY